MALHSSLVTQSSLPVFESNARKRRSLLAPMKTSPPAVAIGPPRFMRPVCCFAGGSSSVIPSGTDHAKSPLRASTAIRRPHGGFWQGQLLSPFVRPSPSTFLSQKRGSAPIWLRRSYCTREPPESFSIQPILPSSDVLTKTYCSFGSVAVPPQLDP